MAVVLTIAANCKAIPAVFFALKAYKYVSPASQALLHVCIHQN
jgi:hypothetical protein